MRFSVSFLLNDDDQYTSSWPVVTSKCVYLAFWPCASCVRAKITHGLIFTLSCSLLLCLFCFFCRCLTHNWRYFFMILFLLHFGFACLPVPGLVSISKHCCGCVWCWQVQYLGPCYFPLCFSCLLRFFTAPKLFSVLAVLLLCFLLRCFGRAVGGFCRFLLC